MRHSGFLCSFGLNTNSWLKFGNYFGKDGRVCRLFPEKPFIKRYSLVVRRTQIKEEREAASQDLHRAHPKCKPRFWLRGKVMVEASGPKSLALGEGGGVRGEDKDRPARPGDLVGARRAVPFPDHFSGPGIRQALSREAPGERRVAAPGAAQVAPGSRTESRASRPRGGSRAGRDPGRATRARSASGDARRLPLGPGLPWTGR